MIQTYFIRSATLTDVPRLPDVELAAATLYLSQLAVTGLTAEILSEPNSIEDFAAAQQADRLWVAANEANEPIGFALLDEIDQWLYLDELDVLPEYGRRGIGTALVKHVCQLAREAGYPGVTLSTFRDVIWNAPFYGRLGFQIVPPHEQTPGLQALVASEKERGLHIDKRVIMSYRFT